MLDIVHVAVPRERDALIAATAFVHGMTVVTGNVADFEATGVALIDPWAETWPAAEGGSRPAAVGVRLRAGGGG